MSQLSLEEWRQTVYSVEIVLNETVSLDDVLLKQEKLGADILLGDKSTVNAADIYSSDRFRQILEALRERYDYIIVDMPPVLLVPPYRQPARRCGAFHGRLGPDDAGAGCRGAAPVPDRRDKGDRPSPVADRSAGHEALRLWRKIRSLRLRRGILLVVIC